MLESTISGDIEGNPDDNPFKPIIHPNVIAVSNQHGQYKPSDARKGWPGFIILTNDDLVINWCFSFYDQTDCKFSGILVNCSQFTPRPTTPTTIPTPSPTTTSPTEPTKEPKNYTVLIVVIVLVIVVLLIAIIGTSIWLLQKPDSDKPTTGQKAVSGVAAGKAETKPTVAPKQGTREEDKEKTLRE